MSEYQADIVVALQSARLRGEKQPVIDDLRGQWAEQNLGHYRTEARNHTENLWQLVACRLHATRHAATYDAYIEALAVAKKEHRVFVRSIVKVVHAEMDFVFVLLSSGALTLSGRYGRSDDYMRDVATHPPIERVIDACYAPSDVRPLLFVIDDDGHLTVVPTNDIRREAVSVGRELTKFFALHSRGNRYVSVCVSADAKKKKIVAAALLETGNVVVWPANVAHDKSSSMRGVCTVAGGKYGLATIRLDGTMLLFHVPDSKSMHQDREMTDCTRVVVHSRTYAVAYVTSGIICVDSLSYYNATVSVEDTGLPFFFVGDSLCIVQKENKDFFSIEWLLEYYMDDYHVSAAGISNDNILRQRVNKKGRITMYGDNFIVYHEYSGGNVHGCVYLDNRFFAEPMIHVYETYTEDAMSWYTNSSGEITQVMDVWQRYTFDVNATRVARYTKSDMPYAHAISHNGTIEKMIEFQYEDEDDGDMRIEYLTRSASYDDSEEVVNLIDVFLLQASGVLHVYRDTRLRPAYSLVGSSRFVKLPVLTHRGPERVAYTITEHGSLVEISFDYTTMNMPSLLYDGHDPNYDNEHGEDMAEFVISTRHVRNAPLLVDIVAADPYIRSREDQRAYSLSDTGEIFIVRKNTDQNHTSVERLQDGEFATQRFSAILFEEESATLVALGHDGRLYFENTASRLYESYVASPYTRKRCVYIQTLNRSKGIRALFDGGDSVFFSSERGWLGASGWRQ